MHGQIGVVIRAVTQAMAHPSASLLAVLVGVGGVVSGVYFGFSPTWETHLNTIIAGLTVVVVFFVQHSQARDTKAIQLKLNELLLAVEGARHTQFIALEHQDEAELARAEAAVAMVLAQEDQAVTDRVAAAEAAEAGKVRGQAGVTGEGRGGDGDG